jgi:hypothetical protein
VEASLQVSKPHPLRTAMEGRDHAAMLEHLAPDVVLLSPVTATPFVGRESVGELLGHLVEEFESWECTAEIVQGDTHVLLIRARIGGREVELADVFVHDANGLVKEMRLHARPMSSIAAFAAVVAPRLARRHGRVRTSLVTAMARPLPRLLAAGDALLLKLVAPKQPR